MSEARAQVSRYLFRIWDNVFGRKEVCQSLFHCGLKQDTWINKRPAGDWCWRCWHPTQSVCHEEDDLEFEGGKSQYNNNDLLILVTWYHGYMCQGMSQENLSGWWETVPSLPQRLLNRTELIADYIKKKIRGHSRTERVFSQSCPSRAGDMEQFLQHVSQPWPPAPAKQWREKWKQNSFLVGQGIFEYKGASLMQI